MPKCVKSWQTFDGPPTSQGVRITPFIRGTSKGSQNDSNGHKCILSKLKHDWLFCTHVGIFLLECCKIFLNCKKFAVDSKSGHWQQD